MKSNNTRNTNALEYRATGNKRGCKPIDNLVCAYQNCPLKSSIRLEFPLGFSALFCNGCANTLLMGGLAKLSSEEDNKSLSRLN